MSSLIGMPSENSRYILCFFLCGCCFTMSLVLTYCLYIFSKIKTLTIYKKRYPLVVKLECYMCLVQCCIIWPLWILHASEFTAFTKSVHADNLNAFFFINHFMYPFFGHAVTCLEAGRLWIMYYKLNNMNALSNNQLWESLIDDTSTMYNWYVMHGTTFGSLRWVMKRAFVYYAFASLTSMSLITSFGFTAYTQAVDCFFYAVPILSILYLYVTLLRKKSLIHDNFLFYLEFKTTNRIFSIGLFLYAFTPLMFALDPYCADMWTAMLGVTILTGPTIISALYIPRMILQNVLWIEVDRKILNDTNPQSSAASLQPCDTASPASSTISYVSDSHVYIEAPKRVCLSEIFLDQVYTQHFIHHIIKEFSLECVLSWIEMKQFGYYLYTQLNALDVDLCMDPSTNPDIEPLPQHIPQSTIVYCDEINDSKEKVMKNFKDKFVALYDKYIDDQAQYQLNISYELKASFDCFKTMHEFDAWNVTENELIGVFHEVIDEMRTFMNTSLFRFTKSMEWKQICGVVIH
eukprot:6912_1